MISQSPNPYLLVAQSLTAEQLRQIAEAIATGHSIELQAACEFRLRQMPPPPVGSSEQDLQSQIKALQKELVAERRHRQAAEHEAILWKQKLAKAMNYLRRHI